MPATPQQEMMLPFLKKEQVAKDTCSFFFDRKGVAYDFLPGQYNRVTLPITATDGRGNSRFFTVSSSPLEKDYLTITTKQGPSDFKKALFNLTQNEKMKFLGPMGGFVLHDEDMFDRVFLAGGIGITPFHSMITYSAAKNLQIPLVLFVSFSVPEEIVFYEELTTIAKEHSNIKIIYTITRPQESQQKWFGVTGRISEDLLKRYVSDITKPTYYIVGPPPMVEGTEKLLEQMGIAPEKVKVEQFTGY